MNDNSRAIIILCSMLSVTDDIRPLTPGEWNSFAKLLVSRQLEPKDVLFMSEDAIRITLGLGDEETQRIMRLLDRSGSLSFEVEKYENIGIKIITRADTEYPKALKQKLKSKCPPLFYVAGDINICDTKAIGFVGSRNIDVEELEQTKTLAKEALNKGYTIVSGGAKGVDQIALRTAFEHEGNMIVYLADSMLAKMKDSDLIQAIRNKKAVLFSAAKPDAGFNTGIAMMRNKYIYAQSEGTIVIKSDYNRGGTWNGAMENIRNKWCTTYCINNSKHKGNIELINKGAIPIDETWDFNLNEIIFATEDKE